jgi:kumamolisin
MQPIKGSERAPMRGARDVGEADPRERLEVTVLLRRKNAQELRDRIKKLEQGDRSDGALSRTAFAERHGSDAGDMAGVKTFAALNGLAVVEADPARRTVILGGTVAQFNRAFGVELRRFEHGDGSYRGHRGAIRLPDPLADSVEAVLGLDNRPQAHPHFRSRRAPDDVFKGATTGAASAAAASTAFTPEALAELYNFPSGASGQNQCVAIIELGGGYRPRDLATYFSANEINPAPTVMAVSVDHAQNTPTGNPESDDGEVMLDIEVLGCVAPDAKIVVYFAPNTDAGFIDAVSQAVHDAVNKPSIVSISWGGPESAWTAQATAAFNDVLSAAATLGVTVCVAAGDSGSSDGVSDGADHVDFPASSPYVLACGGTRVQASDGGIASEVVWNDVGGGATGGGASSIFALPAWQDGLELTRTTGAASALTRRGVPDVSGDADPATGYQVRVDGQDLVFGGTSAVAPLWAGLLARINEIKGQPVGFINPQLYKQPAALREITQGNNGDFAASPGWNACAGLGSPDGAEVAALF